MTAREPAVQPVVAAHRGGARLWPENSLTAFRGAIALGADQVETDVRLSSDREPFLLHDALLDRTTEARGEASALDWARLARVRLRDGAGDTVPHLSTLLGLLAPSRTDLRLELKLRADGEVEGALWPCVRAVLEAHAMLGRTTVTSFDLRYLAGLHAEPLAGRIWLVHRTVLVEAGRDAVLARARGAGIAEIAVHVEQVDEIVRAPLPARPPAIGLYAVNDATQIARALAVGASAFTTDRPDLALRARSGTARASMG